MRRWLVLSSVAVALATIGCDASEASRDALRALAQRDAPCTTSAECCVVFDDCKATAYVVGESDFDRATDLASNLDGSMCARCVAPPIELECVEGSCVGRTLDFDEAGITHRTDHCGPASADPTWQPLHLRASDSGSSTGRILGCGS